MLKDRRVDTYSLEPGEVFIGFLKSLVTGWRDVKNYLEMSYPGREGFCYINDDI